MKFTHLDIENFRHIKDQKVELGNVLTAIAGQNGTGKSSLLGWIAQACSYKGNEKTLLNTPFKSKYSEVFRFCPEKDYSNIYEVVLHYTDTTEVGLATSESKRMTTRYIESDNRYRVDFDGRGNAIDFPIIYLGLKRLIPLATEKNINLIENEIDSSVRNKFSILSKEILFLTRDSIKPEFVRSTNKSVAAMKTNSYGHLGNSAGQDNLGQIISSALSFEILKKNRQTEFNGGLLLIDEIDATLYAGSQIKLVEKLFGIARNLGLQIIFTTHSLEILEYLSERDGVDSKINYLKWHNNNIVNLVNPPIDQIKNNIKIQVGKNIKPTKIKFICEDIVAEKWSNNLLNGTELKDKVEIKHGPLPCGTLLEIIKSKHPVFKGVNVVLDGDCKLPNKLERVIKLPGKDKPEKIFYDYVHSLGDEDEIWDTERNFIHQLCFANYNNQKHKDWFNDATNILFWGKGYSKLFNRWKKDNGEEVNRFLNDLRKMIE